MPVTALESPLSQISFSGANVDTTLTDDRSGLKIGEVFNVAIPTQDVEQTFALPSEVRAFTAKLQLGKLSLRFQASGGYSTRSPGSAYVSGKISPDASALTLYFKSGSASDVLEIETWT